MSARLQIGTPTRPTSPAACGRVRVVAHLGRQVEGDRQAGLALVEQVAEAAVGLLGRGEAGVLAHRPEPAAVHRRLDAPGERELAWAPEVAVLVEAGRCRRPCTGRGPRCRTMVANRSRRSGGRRRAALARRVVAPALAAGSSAPRRAGVVVASLDDDQHVAELDASPGRRPRIRSTVPGRGARSSFCIFIASTASSAGRPRRDRPGRPRPTRPGPG